MEKRVQKILENKYENVVQFNVVNTTPNPTSFNLLDTSESLSSIPSSPTYVTPPNTIYNTFGISPSNFLTIQINTITGDIIACDGSSAIYFFDKNGLFITIVTIPFASTINIITYNTNNNNLYAVDSLIGKYYVIDCSSFSLIFSTTPFGNIATNNASFNAIDNVIYYGSGVNGFYIFNCNTNIESFFTSPTFSPFGIFSVEYNSINNTLYLSENSTNNIFIYDVATNSVSSTTIICPTQKRFFGYNPSNNFMYVGAITDNVYVINCNSNTIISTINLNGSVPFLFALDTLGNNFYITSFVPTLNISIINSTSNTLTGSITTLLPSIGIAFNVLTNSMIFSDYGFNLKAITTTGITSQPFYITGSSNYNAFVNNLNNEPIEIQLFKILTQNEAQLTNQFQLTTIDSNGNQIFFPYFPINKIDTMQTQNIADLNFNNIIFDGRTFVNEYVLNANETISIEIYYKQLDILSATRSYPIFFKPKTQLKEYIKSNFKNFDVE